MDNFNKNAIEQKMKATLENLKKDFSGLRTGRASINMLDPIQVDAYGSKMPLTQMASISVPEPRMLTVQVWDGSNAKAVEKAIRDAGLGLNPQAEGALIRIPVPPLNEERRAELSKVAGKYTEQSRISIRNARREGMEEIKKLEKEGKISEDEQKRFSDEIQKLTDKYIEQIDTLLSDKEKDIMTV